MADACCITGARRSPQPPILQGLPLMSGAHSKEPDMPDSADILWFKNQFQARIEPALAGTPLTVVGMIIARLPGDRRNLVAAAQHEAQHRQDCGPGRHGRAHPGIHRGGGAAHKFCHGFGLFQSNLRLFLSGPDYFAEKRCVRALRAHSWRCASTS